MQYPQFNASDFKHVAYTAHTHQGKLLCLQNSKCLLCIIIPMCELLLPPGSLEIYIVL